MQEKGLEVRSFMPRYGLVNERRNQLHGIIRLSGQNIVINDNDHTLILKVATIQSIRMQTYFIDNEEYFNQRVLLHDETGKFLPDNDERAIFYARGVIETIKNFGWSPDIIHCQGWMSCLVPVFMKKRYIDNPLFTNSKVVYSVYNDTFDKTFTSLAPKLKLSGIPHKDATAYKKATFESMVKSAINYSDAVVISHKDVSEKIRSYIARSKKPFFEHREEQYGDDYLTLYNSII
jgi:starch synthase